MIPAVKSPWLTRFLRRDAERRIARSFSAVRVRGIEHAREALRTSPVLIVSNHTSWWDPLVLQWIASGELAADAYAMMDAKNILRFPFFKRVGAFGVDLDDAADGMRAIRYATKLLSKPGRLVWIFPQGAETPITKRPLQFRPGAAAVARLARHAKIIPAALRYEMRGVPKPELWLSFGVGHDHLAAATPERQVDLVQAEMDRIEAAIHDDCPADFERMMKDASPRDGLLFRVAQAVLIWLTR